MSGDRDHNEYWEEEMRASKAKRASGSMQRSVVLPSNDKKVLDDYKAFRQARAQIHIKQREWHAMSKKTKRALVAMFAALARQHNESS